MEDGHAYATVDTICKPLESLCVEGGVLVVAVLLSRVLSCRRDGEEGEEGEEGGSPYAHCRYLRSYVAQVVFAVMSWYMIRSEEEEGVSEGRLGDRR